ncbi:MAG: molybdenum cofactor-independent xanthine hydroxylase subunit HpxD [Synoicihabitans sp.]
MSASLPLIPPRNCTFQSEDWEVLAQRWFPIAYSDEVIDKPLARTLLDQELIIYRTTNQQVVVAKDLCIHRGVPLRLGWQEGDELVCAYHGFRYASDGRCTKVPALPNLKPPSKLCLFTYPVQERYGLIWTCLSSTPANELPDWPELEDKAYRMMHFEPPVWNCSAGRQLENFLDVVHFSWIHCGSFGNREEPEVHPYEVERTPTGLHIEYPYLAANPEGSTVSTEEAEASATIQRWMVYDVHIPFGCRLRVDYGDNRVHTIFDYAAPISRNQTLIFFFIARNFDHHVPAEELLDWERRILAEDKPIVENQQPEDLPLDLTEEFHLRCDRTSTVFRQALGELGLGKTYTT